MMFDRTSSANNIPTEDMKMEYMVSMKSFKGVWHNEYFVGEGTARAWANDQWTSGAMIVELYKREGSNRNSYRLVKSVKRTAHLAEAIHAAWLQAQTEKYQNPNYEADFSQIYGNYKK